MDSEPARQFHSVGFQIGRNHHRALQPRQLSYQLAYESEANHRNSIAQ